VAGVVEARESDAARVAELVLVDWDAAAAYVRSGCFVLQIQGGSLAGCSWLGWL